MRVITVNLLLMAICACSTLWPGWTFNIII